MRGDCCIEPGTNCRTPLAKNPPLSAIPRKITRTCLKSSGGLPDAGCNNVVVDTPLLYLSGAKGKEPQFVEWPDKM